MLVTDRLIGQPESRARSHSWPQSVPGLAGEFVDSVAVGWEHTLALTCDGVVWAWGNNGDGQLGLGHSTAVREPEKVAALAGRNIRQVRRRDVRQNHVYQ